MKKSKKIGLIFSALLLVGCGLFNATSTSAHINHRLSSSSQDVSDTDSQSDSSESDSDELSDYTQDDQHEDNPEGPVDDNQGDAVDDNQISDDENGSLHEDGDNDSQLEENIGNFQNDDEYDDDINLYVHGGPIANLHDGYIGNPQCNYQCDRDNLRQFVDQLNPAQREALKHVMFINYNGVVNTLDDGLGANQPDDHIKINKLELINCAIDSADLDLVQRVYYTFHFTGNELNEEGPKFSSGYGTPLYHAVCLADYATNAEAAAIVDYLLDQGADPYSGIFDDGRGMEVGDGNWHVNYYVPDLFTAGGDSASRMFLVDTFRQHGYASFPNDNGVRPWLNGEHQLTKAQFRGFVQSLNTNQKNVVRESLVRFAHPESSYLVDTEIQEAGGDDLIAVNKLGLLHDAVRSDDTDLTQQIRESFPFTAAELSMVE